MVDVAIILRKISKYFLLQRWSEIIGTTTKNGIVPVSTSNVKLFLETIWSG